MLTETLPPGSTFNAAGSTAGWTETAPGSGVFEFNVAALAAGTGGTITFSVIVNDPLAAGIDQLVNNVTITDDGTNGADEDPSDNSDNDTDNINAAPDLYVSKDDGGVNVTPGGIVSYTLNYGNDGSQDATNVVITELLPLSTTFDAAGSTVGWTETFPGSGIFEFVVGNVDAGASGSVVFAVRVDPATLAGFIVDNTASIADDGTNGGDEDPTDNSDTDTTPVVDGIDLTITNDDGALTVLPGGTVIYTIDYSNVGTVDATGVVITETLPANSSFDPTNSTAGWVESAPGSGVYEFTVGALNVGDTGSIAFAVIVDDPLVAGVDQLINDASITDDGTNGGDANPANNTDGDIDTILAAPDLFVTKTDGGTITIAGGSVVYTLTYGNNGTQDATGVVITEALPANATFDAASSSPGWIETAPGSGIFQYNVGNVAADSASNTVMFAVIVDNPLPAGATQLNNTVSIMDDGTNGPDEDPSDNSDTDDTPIVTAPDLVISKDDGGVTVTPGGTVIYTINYTNVGTIGSTGVVITETLPVAATFDAASSSPGWVGNIARQWHL